MSLEHVEDRKQEEEIRKQRYKETRKQVPFQYQAKNCCLLPAKYFWVYYSLRAIPELSPRGGGTDFNCFSVGGGSNRNIFIWVGG
jgi:hypothetical protein